MSDQAEVETEQANITYLEPAV